MFLGCVVQVEDDGQQKHLSKTKMEDESQKTKLEQTIKDKLQKLGHEKIGEGETVDTIIEVDHHYILRSYIMAVT